MPREEMEALKKLNCRLALNAVGGKAVGDLTRLLGKGATIVTYGGMSKQPVLAPTSAFIFKDLSLRGFWLTRWKKENTEHAMAEMIKEIAGFMESGSLELRCEPTAFEKF